MTICPSKAKRQEPAAIAGSLVGMRNVGTHKSVALTVHVPEELATAVIAAFGWPTGANPVPVAIARLDLDAPAPSRRELKINLPPDYYLGTTPQEPQEARQPVPGVYGPGQAKPALAVIPGQPAPPRSIAQHIGMLCNSPQFRSWLRMRRPTHWARFVNEADQDVKANEIAAKVVRHICGVDSRRDIAFDNEARLRWDLLESAYDEDREAGNV